MPVAKCWSVYKQFVLITGNPSSQGGSVQVGDKESAEHTCVRRFSQSSLGPGRSCPSAQLGRVATALHQQGHFFSFLFYKNTGNRSHESPRLLGWISMLYLQWAAKLQMQCSDSRLHKVNLGFYYFSKRNWYVELCYMLQLQVFNCGKGELSSQKCEKKTWCPRVTIQRAPSVPELEMDRVELLTLSAVSEL
jgi:hypothetical protein